MYVLSITIINYDLIILTTKKTKKTSIMLDTRSYLSNVIMNYFSCEKHAVEIKMMKSTTYNFQLISVFLKKIVYNALN